MSDFLIVLGFSLVVLSCSAFVGWMWWPNVERVLRSYDD